MTEWRPRKALVALALVALLGACLVWVARLQPARAMLAGRYPAATLFRPDGVITSAPATVAMADLGPTAFVRGTDGSIWWSTQSNGWGSLGQPPGGLAGDPAVVSWGPGRIDLFVQGIDQKLWQRWSGCSGCQWSPWIQPVGPDGVLASSPAVTSWAPDRIDVIVQGTDANLYQRDWDTNGWSGGWRSIGSPPVMPIRGEHAAVTTWAPGRLDVFARGTDNKLWQTYLLNGAWTGWFQPPGTADGTLNAAPAAGTWNRFGDRNRLTIFVQGVDGRLYQTTYDGGWSTWNFEGAPQDRLIDAPEVPSTLQVEPYVLVRGTDNRVYAFFPPDANHRWAVGVQSFGFVDPGRSTPPAGGVPGAAFRSLPTVIRYPVDGPASGAEYGGAAGSHLGSPFPLVVFAHGYDSSPAVYATLLHAWASAGYVVAAPSFPRGTAGGPLNESDLNSQPGDLSFVITQVLALATPGGPLAGVVDPAHIGVAGHSDGASTAAGIGYNSCCHDGRVLADAVMEGAKHNFPGGSWFPPGPSAALLVIQADQDTLNPPALGQAVFNGGRSPKYLLWLVNASHLAPYTSDSSHLMVVAAVTTSFFDRYLKGRPDAATQMYRGATPGLATLTAG